MKKKEEREKKKTIESVRKKDTKKPVAQRHHKVSGALSLLFGCFEVEKGSRVAPILDKGL